MPSNSSERSNRVFTQTSFRMSTQKYDRVYKILEIKLFEMNILDK